MSDCHSSARCDENQSVANRTSTTVHNIHEVQGRGYLFGFVKNADSSRTNVRRKVEDTVWEEYQGIGFGGAILQTSVRTIPSPCAQPEVNNEQ
ncbi:MAG: hypothetical protein PVS3B3_30730 [Ktedonobacteraceae bacterium]